MRTPFLLLAFLSCCAPREFAMPPSPDISFVARRDFEISAELVAAGDLNGDGRADLIVATGAASISVMLGNSDGTFQSAVTYALPQFGNQNISGIAVGDFNHDGRPDVAVGVSLPGYAAYLGNGAQTASGDVLIFLGNGDGTLQAPTTISFSYPVLSVVAGDVNGDGKLDLTVLQADFYYDISNLVQISAEVSVLLGNGDGTFQTPINTSLPPQAISLVVGDVNGDGKPDVVTANQQSISILLGVGDGTFQTPSTLAVPSSSILLGDFNGDGKLDMVVAPSSGTNYSVNNTTISILLGNGNGTFQYPATFDTGLSASVFQMATGDFNGDGKLDVIVGASGIAVLLGKGDGTLGTPQSFAVGSSVNSVVTADWNGDGKADIATANRYNLSVLLGKGDGTFIEAGVASPSIVGSAVIAGDFNGDGKADMVTGGSNGLVVLLGNGDGTFLQSFAEANIGTPSILATTDFNRDGIPDILVVSDTGVYVLLGNGDGTFQQAMALSNVNSAYFAAIADFNLDGKPDVVLSTLTGTALLLGNGDGTFQAGVLLSVAISSVVAGDFNGDGKPDLVLANSGGSAQFLAGNGDGTFRPPVPLPNVIGAFLETGDFNNDGKLDLAFGLGQGPPGTPPTQIGIQLGNGDGTFQPPFSQVTFNQVPTQGPVAMIVVDLNGDGKLDLVTFDSLTDDVCVWLGNGDGTLKKPLDFGTGRQTVNGLVENLAAADFNGDGLLDLVVIATVTPSPWLLFQVGNGTGPAVVTLSPGGIAFGQQLVGTSATQKITVTNTGHSAASISGIVLTDSDFTETNMCGNTLAAGASCSVTVTFAPTVVGANSGALRVTTTTRTLNGMITGSATDLTLSASGSASVTVNAGQTATYSLNIVPVNGFTGSVALTCSGAPSEATCTIAPSTVSFSSSASSPASASVSVTTAKRSGIVMRIPSSWYPLEPISVVAFGLGVAAALLLFLKNRRFAMKGVGFVALLTLALALYLNGCGGGSGGGSTVQTPAGTYKIVVTANVNGATRTATLTMVVQ